MTPSSTSYDQVLRAVLAYARRREYVGPDYADGMSSRIRRALPVESKWWNLLFQETVKRAPIDIRPLMLVEQRRNYQGIALFAMANENARRLGETEWDTSREDYRSEARSLGDWLVENRTRGYSGFCAGYQHPVQFLTATGQPGDPDVVTTSYAVKALLALGGYDADYAERARTAAAFVVDDLDYREVEGGAKIDYHFNHPDEWYTLNAGAIGARLLIDLYDRFGDDRLRERACALLDYIADRQAEVGGWPYREPESATHLSMDTHHNGFIIESLQRYAGVTGSDRFAGTLEDALAFFRNTLFEPDGAPNWDEQRSYPRDVHAAAQGVLVFTYAGELAFASRIIDWSLEHLYAGDGRFYFRKHRFHTKRVVLMRWCQAWMAYALSEYLATRSEVPRASDPSPVPTYP